MGTRLEIYIENEATAKEIIAISKSFGVDAQIIGYVESSEKAEVEVKHNQISYHYFA
jgi:phosphoribosylformylglycinamidine cyclo-ligase